MGIIYIITNTVNNKVYIGQTTNSLERRFYEHKQCSRRLSKYQLDKTRRIPKDIQNSHLYKAMVLYGEDKFTAEALLEINQEFLDEYEIKFIKLYNAVKDGYNLTSGGGSFTHSEETIKVMQIAKRKNLNKHRHPILHDLPVYTRYRKTKTGYELVAINNHPLCKSKTFSNVVYGSIEAAKVALLECYKQLELQMSNQRVERILSEDEEAFLEEYLQEIVN